MQTQISLTLSPREAADEKTYLRLAAAKLNISADSITYSRILRRSTDARKRDIKINLSVQLFINESVPSERKITLDLKNVTNAKPVIVIGTGPAGLFAAIKLIELGLKPLLFERGKEIYERKKDVALISRQNIVDADSNYCFGEGGAGTFSDGKLYTRSNKRGNLQRVFEMFHYHGADESILYEAHPHIGTDKLPEIIKHMRQTITDCGGAIYFQTRVTDFVIHNDVIKGVVTANGDTVDAQAVVLATGHSARDIYRLMAEKNIALESKPFAMGLRVEHPQELIDNIQYHGQSRGEYLPAASYNLVEQVDGRGVFSFCMCPGGFIVPSATLSDQVVVNGMSPAKRNSPFANSGIVVEIRNEDLTNYVQHGPLAGLEFQQQLENMAWQNGARNQMAPAQRLADFVKGKKSATLPDVSYFPGIISSPVHHWLPEFMSSSLRKAFVMFDKKMHGYLTNEAVVLGVESRTSSPVRIPRDKDTFQHIQIAGLFPCGEGSGYAGGITSSAMDGENAAIYVAQYVNSLK